MRDPSLRQVTDHAAVGAGLGALFTFGLVLQQANVGAGASPDPVPAVLICFFAALFAVNAGITGFLFSALDHGGGTVNKSCLGRPRKS